MKQEVGRLEVREMGIQGALFCVLERLYDLGVEIEGIKRDVAELRQAQLPTKDPEEI